MVATHNKLRIEEEKLKEKVYKTFDDMTKAVSATVKAQKASIEGGNFDDKEAFMVYGELSEAHKRKHEVEKLISQLYHRPYFSHIEMYYDGNEDEVEHYFLSDCETLEKGVSIGKDGYLLPFKQDNDRPISKALFHCYQAKRGEAISYTGPKGDVFTLVPQLICDTDIKNRKLVDVIQLYPIGNIAEIQVTADEMLESRLQENRDNPALRNIISTLQLKQFEIIGTDVNESFVVQGCAGSGKSQCLIHRLFFLRDELSQDGWNKVLLLTPTKLFREYSSELMKRYQLSDIFNCSLADLYRIILGVYDDRFKDRQYVYRLTEEYLPEEYLFSVYQEENVQRIEAEIDNAIQKYVTGGCKALGITVPDNINIEVIEKIVAQLDVQMRLFDEREEALQDNEEYQEKRRKYEQLLKDNEYLKKKLLRYQEELKRNFENQKELSRLIHEVQKAEQEKQTWIELREKRIQDANSELEIAVKRFDRGTDLQAPAKYAKQLFLVKDLTEGVKFESDKEELAILDELITIAKNELQKVVRDKKPQKVLDKYLKRQREIEYIMTELVSEINVKDGELEEYSEWLRKTASEYGGEEAKNTLLRSEMQQSRFFLSRIESTIFEKEVWNALAPVKEKYNIQTLEIEEVKDGKHKESRILYKSDLLFYIRIYMKLHSSVKLPELGLICIDEGQDLHRADYDILHGLFPNAVFNIFGDVAQVLHSACGISRWEAQTGISNVYSLTTNYRNSAAIVDFCNQKFDVRMDYIGCVKEWEKPVEITDQIKAREILTKEDVILIVKDKALYIELCEELDIDIACFIFLDTTTEKLENEEKQCYSIFAAKGLEFSNVFVFARNMTKNQKVVACTRAMGGLYYYE
jgi:DNA helicase IV